VPEEIMIIKDFKECMKIYVILKKYIKNIKNSFILAWILKIITIPLLIIPPILFKYLIDDAYGKKNWKILKWICIGYIVVFICKLFADMCTTKALNRIENRFMFHVRTQVWEKYLAMPYHIYEAYDTGDLKLRIDDDVSIIKNIIPQQLINFPFAVITFSVYLIAIFTINWKMAIISSSVIPLMAKFSMIIGNWAKDVNNRMRNARRDYNSWQHDTLQHWQEIKSLNIEKRKTIEFIEHRHKIAKIEVERNVKSFFPRRVVMVYLEKDFFTKMFIYFLGGIFILNGSISIGAIIVFMKYYADMFTSMQEINQMSMELKGNMPEIERIFEIIETDFSSEIKKDEDENIIKHKHFDEETVISLKNVTFKYHNGNKTVLEKISFDIKKGEFVAIAGKSGAGKTTLIKVLMNLYKPQGGTVMFKGKRINEIAAKDYYKNIAVVMQDCYLFNTSIKENLLIAKQNASQKEIEDACKKANIYEFIQNQRDKFDTVIGEKGVKLSGGQRQRIAIAQVLLRDPSVVIFDEATSAIDYISEQKINESIVNMAKERTVIVVAHRLSSVIKAEKIVVMKNGKVQSFGTHHELMEQCNEYRELFRGQYTLSN